ncbi:MAG: hypothetical protein JSU94_12470 [Phycisphaerales bacterium]|nr:MAG: hypothetical protein JSU94_12470 [Phycisphaerales bacterium]
MKSSVAISIAIWAGIAGAILSLLLLVASGSGDDPGAYQTYLLASAIVLGFGVLAAAVSNRDRG